MRLRWNRDLPLEELLFDRWERARYLGFGAGASIYHTSYVFGDVRVGANTWIGPLTVLEGSGGLTIGAHCSISSGVQILPRFGPVGAHGWKGGISESSGQHRRLLLHRKPDGRGEGGHH